MSFHIDDILGKGVIPVLELLNPLVNSSFLTTDSIIVEVICSIVRDLFSQSNKGLEFAFLEALASSRKNKFYSIHAYIHIILVRACNLV